MARRSNSKPATSKNTRKPATRKRAPARQNPEIPLRPEHQREIFALFLIGIAAVTIIFHLSDSAGVLGGAFLEMTRNLFGWGALLAPLTIGLLGVAILLAERREDAELNSATMLGVLLVLFALLSLLEFPVDRSVDASGQGGGMVGYALSFALISAIGRPAALLIVCLVGLIGILLTFNITLRELLGGMRNNWLAFWARIWSGATGRALPATAPAPRAEGTDVDYLPPPGADDLVPTPIAERPARASLFQRPGAAPPQTPPVPVEKARVEQPVEKPAPRASAAQAKPTTLEKTAPPGPLVTEKPAVEPAAPTGAVSEAVVQPALEGFDVPAIHRAWPLPAFDMLDYSAEGGITDDERRVKARLIEETLASFKVEARVVEVNTGPAVTQFGLQPAVGVKVNKITNLEKDLALALAAPSIRIEAPIPGKNVVGIEIPNSAISLVTLRDVVDSEEFEASKGRLKLPLGKDVSGTPVVADLARMPHLLIGGSTGSGKSVAVNSFICALLLKHTPDELKFLMVDPKMVELIVYNQIPHLLSPVVTEMERVVPTLKWATREMERRYKIFARYGIRNIETYKQTARRRPDLEPMPYIIVIIDELADLMMMAPDEVETQICRLAQMARATGIHLIIATQRPSVDVITGLIKANFPSRMAFAVTSQIDSRVILDVAGADQLLGRGDMLYMAADAAKLVRIQGTYVADREIEQLVTFWRNAQPPDKELGRSPAGATAAQAATPAAGTAPSTGNSQNAAQRQAADDALLSALIAGAGSREFGTATPAVSPDPQTATDLPPFRPPGEFLQPDEQEALLGQARDLVRQHSRASASLLQRRLRIGYSKAAQLIDLLEQQGVLGPPDGGRSREVLPENAANQDAP